jgi:hypothetical protein
VYTRRVEVAACSPHLPDRLIDLGSLGVDHLVELLLAG